MTLFEWHIVAMLLRCSGEHLLSSKLFSHFDSLFSIFYSFDILHSIFCHFDILFSIFCHFDILRSILVTSSIFCVRYFATSPFCFRYFATSIFFSRYFATSIFCLSIFRPSIFCLSIFCPSIFCFRYFAISINCVRYFDTSIFCLSIFYPSIFCLSTFCRRYFAFSIFCDSIFYVSIFYHGSVQTPPPPSLARVPRSGSYLNSNKPKRGKNGMSTVLRKHGALHAIATLPNRSCVKIPRWHFLDFPIRQCNPNQEKKRKNGSVPLYASTSRCMLSQRCPIDRASKSPSGTFLYFPICHSKFQYQSSRKKVKMAWCTDLHKRGVSYVVETLSNR